MDKWEYRTLYIVWKELKDSRGRKYNEWVVEFNDGSRVEGLNAILNREGSSGWELINLVTQYISAGVSPTAFSAIFKRRAQEATS